MFFYFLLPWGTLESNTFDMNDLYLIQTRIPLISNDCERSESNAFAMRTAFPRRFFGVTMGPEAMRGAGTERFTINVYSI